MDEYVGKLFAHIFLIYEVLSLNVIIEPTEVIMLAESSESNLALTLRLFTPKSFKPIRFCRHDAH